MMEIKDNPQRRVEYIDVYFVIIKSKNLENL